MLEKPFCPIWGIRPDFFEPLPEVSLAKADLLVFEVGDREMIETLQLWSRQRGLKTLESLRPLCHVDSTTIRNPKVSSDLEFHCGYVQNSHLISAIVSLKLLKR